MVSSCRLVLISLTASACLLDSSAQADPPLASYIIQTVAGSDDSGDGGSALSAALSQPEGIAVDRSGNVFVADAADHRVRKIAPDGTIQTFAGTGVAGFAGDGGPANAALLNQPYGLALDRAGNLYIADLGNARVRRVSSGGTIDTVAGGGLLPATSTGQGGPATSAQLVQPRNVAFDAAGSLYISDFGGNQVYHVTSGGALSSVAGTGVAGFSGVGTSALLAQLNAPAGLAVDPSGALYIADSGNNRVRKVYNGVIITVFSTPAPTGVALDSTGVLYVAAPAYFGTVSQPIPGLTPAMDVALDHSDNIFATSGALVLEIPAGGVATTLAGGAASRYFGGDGGPATAAQLYSPSGIVLDTTGNWYIADTLNNRIRMVDTAGVISTIADTAMNAPRAIAIDASNNLYVADTGDNEVLEIAPDGTVTSIASQLNNPVSIAVDRKGSIYIADSGNNRVVQVTAQGATNILASIDGPRAVAIDPSGNVLVAGATQVWRVTPDGTATSLTSGLNSPSGMTVAPDGSLLIADTGANVIRQLRPSGLLTPIAGTGAAGFLGDGAPSLSARLNAPTGIAVGANGTILIADSGNNRIRSLTPAVIAPESAVAVVNAASLAAGPIAPGEIVTIFGAGLDPANTQLLFDGQPGKLFYTSATQINALAPAKLIANTTTTMSIVVNGVTMAESLVPVVSAAPGIFTIAGEAGQAAANNQDGSINSASNPAARGSVVSLYATGQGSGSGAVALTIAGYTAPLLYAGPAPGFPGLMQINAQIPGGFLPPGIQPVLLSIGGVTSQRGVTVAIH